MTQNLTKQQKRDIILELLTYPKETGFYTLIGIYKQCLHNYADKSCKVAIGFKLAIDYLNQIKLDFK
jgi:hypothetical protein